MKTRPVPLKVLSRLPDRRLIRLWIRKTMVEMFWPLQISWPQPALPAVKIQFRPPQHEAIRYSLKSVAPSCHTRTFTTAPAGTSINGGAFTVPAALGDKIIHPFSDFALHDVGTGDGIVQMRPIIRKSDEDRASLGHPCSESLHA
jgi:hypothetical protein